MDERRIAGRSGRYHPTGWLCGRPLRGHRQWADPAIDPVLLAGGANLLVAVELLEPLAEARPVVTAPFGLPSTAVIHVAAPAWAGGGQGEDGRLAAVIEAVLAVATRRHLPRVAFSPIGPGFPLDRAASIAVETIDAVLFAMPAIAEVLIVCPTERTQRTYEIALSEVID